MKIKFFVTFTIALVAVHLAAAQTGEFNYRREILGTTDSWRSLTLPNDIFEHCKNDLSDLRVIGTAENGEAVEAPYIIRQTREKEIENTIPFTVINRSRSEVGFHYTFAISAADTINEIQLNFDEENFDWKLQLEGSDDLSKWFSIVDEYRILSIKNEITRYSFTKLSFPDADFKYFRITVKSDKDPRFASATLTERQMVAGKTTEFELAGFDVTEDKQRKETILDIKLRWQVPISSLTIEVTDENDYYRPITIKYLSHISRINAEEREIFNVALSGILSSLEKKSFQFAEVRTSRLQVVIANRDNQPLHFSKSKVGGIPFDLILRFSEPAKYYLYYDNAKAARPEYDIKNFEANIPAKLPELSLETEELIGAIREERQPLFGSARWMWLVMILAIAMLAWFSIQMLRKK